MKFVYTNGPFRDECAYNIEEYKAINVGQFIQEVLKERPDEWGYIRVGARIEDPKCEYKKGTLVSELPKQYLDCTISHITSFGGWTRMDYNIEIK